MKSSSIPVDEIIIANIEKQDISEFSDFISF